MKKPQRQRIARLYGQGESAKQLAARFGISSQSVVRYAKAAGIPRRPGGPPGLPRTICEHPGCRREVPRPHARFCSRAHTRIHPPATPRPCEQCGTIFTPPANKAARGVGRFHTYPCFNKWRTGRPRNARPGVRSNS